MVGDSLLRLKATKLDIPDYHMPSLYLLIFFVLTLTRGKSNELKALPAHFESLVRFRVVGCFSPLKRHFKIHSLFSVS
jgi:hypothetical protein